MKKSLAVLLAMLLLSGAYAGCKSGNNASGTDLVTEALPASEGDLETDETSQKAPVSLKGALDLIESQTTFGEDLTELKSARVASQFGLDQDKIKDAICKVAASGSSPDLILLIETASEEDSKALYDTLETYQQNETERWASYNASEKPKMESAVLDYSGNFVVFCVSEDNSLVGVSVFSYLRY